MILFGYVKYEKRTRSIERFGCDRDKYHSVLGMRSVRFFLNEFEYLIDIFVYEQKTYFKYKNEKVLTLLLGILLFFCSFAQHLRLFATKFNANTVWVRWIDGDH